ncbi:hypothetical protein R1sor_016486 [Riccia sorocarpa]|uniref:Coiled-coil domain-containing protein SCD2 n=1 Tax=Riccia sorocarpa TaxID=122646 RepID=A0ABD3HID9_9MARC
MKLAPWNSQEKYGLVDRSKEWGLTMANADGQNHLFAGRERRVSTDGPPTGVHHVRSASHSGLTPARRSKGYAQKEAAARLARVMASANTDDDYDEELQFERQPMPSYGASRDSSPRVVRPNLNFGSRDPSPRVMRQFNDTVPASSLIGRPAVAVVKPAVAMHHRPKFPARPITSDIPVERRSSVDLGYDTTRAPGRGNGRDDSERMEEAALRDEIDILEEDKEILEKKLQVAEEKLMERELRMKELEKQVAHLGEGISLEARLISRKEAALRQREAALKAQKEQVKDTKDDEIAALQLAADTLKQDIQSANERVETAEQEARELRSVTQRMVLTREEQEEVRMKRCWLSRYWELAVKYQIFPELASRKQEHWHALAPLPMVFVTAVGHGEESSNAAPGHKKSSSIMDLNDLTSGEGNMEGMLAVEKGLRELAFLNVEQAVMLAMSENQHPHGTVRGELTSEEKEDVSFKYAWLVYFWRRAKNYNVEKDIAEDRLTYWKNRSNQPPSSHDVVDVEQGLLELQKLGIEEQLWEASRKEIASGRLFEGVE